MGRYENGAFAPISVMDVTVRHISGVFRAESVISITGA
jgi:hypothetical protein